MYRHTEVRYTCRHTEVRYTCRHTEVRYTCIDILRLGTHV